MAKNRNQKCRRKDKKWGKEETQKQRKTKPKVRSGVAHEWASPAPHVAPLHNVLRHIRYANAIYSEKPNLNNHHQMTALLIVGSHGKTEFNSM